ncbi:MAG: YHYH protein [Chloroflexota bacterium]
MRHPKLYLIFLVISMSGIVSCTSTPTPASTNTPQRADAPIWLLNEANEGATHIRQADGTEILVNVQSADMVTIEDTSFVLIEASGIPNYTHEMTDADISWLNGRPKADTDFVTGGTTVTVGQLVPYGGDIGYRSEVHQGGYQCPVGEGYGYWPPGPDCPFQVDHAVHFPILLTVDQEGECETGLGTIGLWVNGTAIFNWGDGFTYKREGTWHNLAPEAEAYDLDICGGHAPPSGHYHHHTVPTCLGEQLGDQGQEHSPIYGLAADGYPVYGPWHSDGILAKSCWKLRDYDDSNSATGCGGNGQRDCVLVDNYDSLRCVQPADTVGPSTQDRVRSLSGNEFTAVSGFYFEDYYYDSSCTAQGDAYLDDHNGHSHDGLGYHYHTTIREQRDGTYDNVFPYIIGPTFYGELAENSVTRCGLKPPGPPPNLDLEQENP